MNWRKISKAKWFIPLVGLVALGITASAMAASGWFSTTVPAIGMINVTPQTPNYKYTLPPNIDFGTTSFVVGSPVTLTADVNIDNTGNQAITGLLIAGSNLPSWITSVTISQNPVPAGQTVQEIITLSGVAPSTPQTVNLVGTTALNGASITITPES
jgi:hypothetical protein